MRRALRKTLGGVIGFGASLAGGNALAETLSVGPQGAYAAPCAAFAVAKDGDTIEIDATGSYTGDVCAITKNQLTIRGKGGLAQIDADGKNAQGKGTWVVQGADTHIENIEFSGAKVPDLNGAGIRQEGKNLTVEHCYFHDNENGILAGDSAGSEITILHSEFDQNGAGDGYSHNLYINHVAKLTFKYNWSHRSVIGHLLKSRAAESYVLYNRISGEPGGTSSYELNFPNGGKTYVIGNLLEQSEATDNPTLIAYLEEGTNPANPSHQLYVVNNTLVNDKHSGTFLRVTEGASPAVVTNNLFVGGGTPSSGPAALQANLTEAPCFVDAAGFDYHLAPNTPCVDSGVDPGDGDGFSLTPDEVYVHPVGNAPRTIQGGALDVGAFELGSPQVPSGGTSGLAGAGPEGHAAGGNATGGSGTGGALGSGASGGAPGAGSPSAAAPGDDGGCACRSAAPRTSTRVGGWLALAALGGAVGLRRRRAHWQ